MKEEEEEECGAWKFEEYMKLLKNNEGKFWSREKKEKQRVWKI